MLGEFDTLSDESIGRLVREVWVAWAHEQPNPKPSWLQGWEELTEPEREVDRRIAAAIRERVLSVVSSPSKAPVLLGNSAMNTQNTMDHDPCDALIQEYQRREQLSECLSCIRRTYGVPAHFRQRVRVFDGREGIIVGGRAGYIEVWFPGDTEETGPRSFHPTWKIEYLQTRE